MSAGLGKMLVRFTESSERYWFAEYPYAVLERYRRVLAVILFIFFGRLFPLLREGLTNSGIHISSDLITAFHPVSLPLLPSGLFVPFFLLLMFSFVALFFFPRTRWPAMLGAVLIFYIFDADYIAAYAGHKIVLIALLVLAFAPCPPPGKESIPAWPIRILQLLLISTYLGNGVGKFFFGDWLDHPELLWSVVGGKFFGPVTAVVSPAIPLQFWTICEYFALVFELWLPWGLLIPRARKITLGCGLVFHTGIAVLLQGLWPFTLTILNLYLVFLPFPRKSDVPAGRPTAV